MMRNKAYMVLILISLLVTSQAYGGAARQVSIAPIGKTVITASAAKVTIKVEVITHEINIKEQDRENENIPVTACTYSRFPCSIVDRLSISVDGKPIIIPHSVFLDLADINQAEIKINKNKYSLHLNGGDASEAYNAIIEFDRTRVRTKRLYDYESDALLQETIYHFVELGP